MPYFLTIYAFDHDIPDPTSTFPSGAQGAHVGSFAGNWQVFSKVGYQGPHAVLKQGQLYGDIATMTLNDTVKSIRRC